MSTSVASVTKHFPSAENGFTTTTSGSVSSGAATVGLNSVAGYANGEVAVFVIDPDNEKKQTFTGTIDTSGVQVTGVIWTAGTNVTHNSGATVVDYATATHVSMISKGLLVEHDQDGTHGAITTSSISNAGALTQTGASTLVGALTINSYDGWITSTDTWVYASASSFTIAGVDRTAQFPKGTKIKLTQTSAKYFYVTSSSFSTNTTVNVFAGTDYTLANAAITAPNYSYMDSPQAFPKEFVFNPGFTNWTIGTGGSAVTTALFAMDGNGWVDGRITSILGSSGASVGSGVSFNLPVTAITNMLGAGTFFPIGQVQIEDTGNASYFGTVRMNATTTAQVLVDAAGATYRQPTALSSTVPFNFAAGDGLDVLFRYKAA